MKFFRTQRPLDDAYEQARRTHDALAADTLAVWPWWLERQRRPAFAGSVGPGDLGLVENTTGRTWTSIGPLDGVGASVDPAGLVAPEGASWSLDWWIGAEDRWYFPSAEAATRQVRNGAAPVLETSVRVPGGDVTQTVYAAAAADGSPATIVEITNHTPVPVALAFSIRPAGPLGVGRITEVSSVETTVDVDAARAVVFDRAPAHALAVAGGDCVDAIVAGEAGSGAAVRAEDADGIVTAAWVFPLAHTATIRCWLPTRSAEVPEVGPGDIASGWTRHLDKAARLELGDPLYDDSYLAAVTDLLRTSGRGIRLAPVGREGAWGEHDRGFVIRAMARCGLERETAEVLGELYGDGSPPRDPASQSELLGVIGAAAGSAEGTDAVEAVLGSVARMVAELPDAETSAPNPIASALDRVGQPDVAERSRSVAVPRTVVAPTAFAEAFLGAADAAAAGEDGGLEDVQRLLRVGSATGAWPTAVHPRLEVGAAGSGNDPVSSAAVVLGLARLMVRATDDTLELFPAFSQAWLGQAVETHDLGTPFGRLSFAVRWHGARPALLWELRPTWEAARPVALTAPTLDPSWRTTDVTGDVLLAEPAFDAGQDAPVSFQ